MPCGFRDVRGFDSGLGVQACRFPSSERFSWQAVLSLLSYCWVLVSRFASFSHISTSHRRHILDALVSTVEWRSPRHYRSGNLARYPLILHNRIF